MEADTWYNLPSTSWRPRKAGSITPTQPLKPENWEANGLQSWYKSADSRTRSINTQGQGRIDVPAPAESKPILFLPPCSIPALKGLMMPTHTGKSIFLLNLTTQMLTSYGTTVTDTSKNNVCQLSGHPLSQSSWYIHPSQITIYAHLYIVCMLSHVQLFVTLWTMAHQAPLFMGFSRQEYWSGLPFPSPGDLPNPGIELVCPVSPAFISRFFTTEPLGKPHLC